MSFQNCTVKQVGVNPELYHAAKADQQRGSPDYVMSPSALRAFGALPSRWRRGWNPPTTKAKEWGNLVDCRTLTPEQFGSRFAVLPAKYTVLTGKCPGCGSISDAGRCSKCKRDREPFNFEKPWNSNAGLCAEWEEERTKKGLVIVKPEMLADCDAAVKRLFEVVDGDDTIQRWFDACDRQVWVTGQWVDEPTGLTIPVGALLDFVPRLDTEFCKCLGDFKTTFNAHPLKFQRQAFDLGYHIQAAFDLDIYRAATGEDRNTWCFIIQESFDPWEPNRAMYGVEGDMGQPGFVELGRMAQFGGYERLLTNYCQCLKHNRWPSYNQNDEAVQGWCVLRPEAFQAERAAFAPSFDLEPDEPEIENPDTNPDGSPKDLIP